MPVFALRILLSVNQILKCVCWWTFLCVIKVAQPADEPAGEAPDEPMEHWGSEPPGDLLPVDPRPTWHLMQLTRVTLRGESYCCDVPLAKLLIQNILGWHPPSDVAFVWVKVYHYTINKFFFSIVLVHFIPLVSPLIHIYPTYSETTLNIYRINCR